VKEAITRAGYEFVETDNFYYLIRNLKYVSSAFRPGIGSPESAYTKFLEQEDAERLVGLSNDIQKARLKRAQEMEWEDRVRAPVPVIVEPPRRLAIEPPPPPRSSPWYHEEDRYIEREGAYRGGRPPPPRY
jgi:hypothetical protein